MYRPQPMDELYGGNFSREFVLFSGEELEYYITAEQENQEQLTQKGVLKRKREPEEEAKSRYGRINRMAKALGQGKYTETEELLEEYWRMEDLVERAFQNECR